MNTHLATDAEYLIAELNNQLRGVYFELDKTSEQKITVDGKEYRVRPYKWVSD